MINGFIPGYLNRDRVRDTIRKVCDEYSTGSKDILEFEELEMISEEDQDKVDITFGWKLFKSDQDVLQYDGPGGVLGKAGNDGFVHFDLAERWYVLCYYLYCEFCSVFDVVV